LVITSRPLYSCIESAERITPERGIARVSAPGDEDKGDDDEEARL
jgi:hypothetical protein